MRRTDVTPMAQWQPQCYICRYCSKDKTYLVAVVILRDQAEESDCASGTYTPSGQSMKYGGSKPDGDSET